MDGKDYFKINEEIDEEICEPLTELFVESGGKLTLEIDNRIDNIEKWKIHQAQVNAGVSTDISEIKYANSKFMNAQIEINKVQNNENKNNIKRFKLINIIIFVQFVIDISLLYAIIH